MPAEQGDGDRGRHGGRQEGPAFRAWLQSVYDEIKDKVTAEELRLLKGQIARTLLDAPRRPETGRPLGSRPAPQPSPALGHHPSADHRQLAVPRSRRSGHVSLSVASMLVGLGDRHRRRPLGPMAGGCERAARLLCRHHALDPPAGHAGLGLLRLSAAGRALADASTAGIVGLGVHLGAYVAETVRAGLTSVRRNQMQAALALGMSRLQAIRTDHSAAGVDPHAAGARLAVRHRHQGQRDRLGHRRAGTPAPDPVVAGKTYRPFELYTAAMLVYFLLCYPVARARRSALPPLAHLGSS